jgi:hypothetical protein
MFLQCCIPGRERSILSLMRVLQWFGPPALWNITVGSSAMARPICTEAERHPHS